MVERLLPNHMSACHDRSCMHPAAYLDSMLGGCLGERGDKGDF